MNDINSVEQLLNGNTTSSTATTDFTSAITQIVAWVVIPSIIFSLIIIAILIIYAIRKRKVENAILEIRDILSEMQKSQNPPKPIAAPITEVNEQPQESNPTL